MADAEPRRSVRATKGQHKALDALDSVFEPPKKRAKKAKVEEEEEEDEIIRCVCGATEQDDESEETWYACDQCQAWQHAVCVDMPQDTSKGPEEYFCEQCRPDLHKPLVAQMKRGEQPWIARRRAYEEEQARPKGKRGGRKKGQKVTAVKVSKKKKDSDLMNESFDSRPPPTSVPSLPDAKKKKESRVSAGLKRKAHDSEDAQTEPEQAKPKKARRSMHAEEKGPAPAEERSANASAPSTSRKAQGPPLNVSPVPMPALGKGRSSEAAPSKTGADTAPTASAAPETGEVDTKAPPPAPHTRDIDVALADVAPTAVDVASAALATAASVNAASPAPFVPEPEVVDPAPANTTTPATEPAQAVTVPTAPLPPAVAPTKIAPTSRTIARSAPTAIAIPDADAGSSAQPSGPCPSAGALHEPPADLATKAQDLPKERQGPAQLFTKNLVHALGALEAEGVVLPAEGLSKQNRAAQFALQIEQEVHDTHSGDAYANQARSLATNLKSNKDLCRRLIDGSLTPAKLASMSGDDLASAELKRRDSKMKAMAERQSIINTDDDLPRIRKTHKGDEVVGEDTVMSEEGPAAETTSAVRRPSLPAGPKSPVAPSLTSAMPTPQDSAVLLPSQTVACSPQLATPKPTPAKSGRRASKAKADSLRKPSQSGPPAAVPPLPLSASTVSSPASLSGPAPSPLDVNQAVQKQFDIKEVFSSVKSPVIKDGNRRPSIVTAPVQGPGVDPDVDRLLRDGTESPPYSPTEMAPAAGLQSGVVWSGDLLMSRIASAPFQVAARHVAGANLEQTVNLPWTTLMPKSMTVCGRLEANNASEYIEGLRISGTDVIVLALEPMTETGRQDMYKVIEYFHSKQRWGVIDDKGVAQVRDTYLIPLTPGDKDDLPSFFKLFYEHPFPHPREHPMLVAVIVYRGDTETLLQVANANPSVLDHHPALQQLKNAPSPNAPQNPETLRRGSLQGPVVSPTSPLGPYTVHALQNGSPSVQQQTWAPMQPSDPNAEAHLLGVAVAQEILGELVKCPTAQFLLPHAAQMTREEWHLIQRIYSHDERARGDLPYLSNLLDKEGEKKKPSPATAKQARGSKEVTAELSPQSPPNTRLTAQPQPPQVAQQTQPSSTPSSTPARQEQYASLPVKETPVPLPPMPGVKPAAKAASVMPSHYQPAVAGPSR